MPKLKGRHVKITSDRCCRARCFVKNRGNLKPGGSRSCQTSPENVCSTLQVRVANRTNRTPKTRNRRHRLKFRRTIRTNPQIGLTPRRLKSRHHPNRGVGPNRNQGNRFTYLTFSRLVRRRLVFDLRVSTVTRAAQGFSCFKPIAPKPADRIDRQ